MKKIVLISLILLSSCTKVDIEPQPNVLVVDNIFSVKESKVTNGQSIHFDVPSSGTYILTLINQETGQVISREKFNAQSGENVKKIYTNSLPKGYLSLVLEDINKNQINKTTIINN
jgi:hypothetical protein